MQMLLGSQSAALLTIIVSLPPSRPSVKATSPGLSTCTHVSRVTCGAACPGDTHLDDAVHLDVRHLLLLLALPGAAPVQPPQHGPPVLPPPRLLGDDLRRVRCLAPNLQW